MKELKIRVMERKLADESVTVSGQSSISSNCASRNCADDKCSYQPPQRKRKG